MRRRWIVDTSNVMGSRPDQWWRDRPAALIRLVDEIARWRRAVDEPVLAVADGYPSARLPEGTTWGVHLRYAHSAARDAADDEIVRVVRNHPEPRSLTVVTSDRRLCDRVAELGAATIGARAFLDELFDIEGRRSDRAVLTHFGIDESALLGFGGEARVFALDAGRVLRLPHPGGSASAQEERARFLDHLRDADLPFAVPEVFERHEVHGRTVVIERRLPGTDALGALGRPGVDRAALVRSHLDSTAAIADLPCPAARFGEIWGSDAIRRASFASWSAARLGRSLERASAAYAHVDASDLTHALVHALDQPEPDHPVVVHLDAYLGNMLVDGDAIVAVLDFGPMTIGGPRHLDSALAIAYLAPEITPTATDEDRAVASRWAEERGLTRLLEPARRWAAGYWASATDDHALQRWCRRVLVT